MQFYLLFERSFHAKINLLFYTIVNYLRFVLIFDFKIFACFAIIDKSLKNITNLKCFFVIIKSQVYINNGKRFESTVRTVF